MPADDIQDLISRARELSWQRFGKRVSMYLPGMFIRDGERGHYPAVSITGGECGLQCDHCAGEILKPMPAAMSPEALVARCLRLRDEGATGFLITGGSDPKGRLPWHRFLRAVAKVKQRTGLPVSVHSGMVDEDTARGLKDAGVDQALIDVVGAEETWREVMHLPDGLTLLRRSLDALYDAELEVVPHVVMGIHYGRLLGERAALDMLLGYLPSLLVWVAFMPLRRTPMEAKQPLPLEDAALLLAESRLMFPDSRISLGCARPRGTYGRDLERLAVDAGMNRIAVYSDETLEYAKSLGLQVDVHGSCCSATSPVGDALPTSSLRARIEDLVEISLEVKQ